MSWLDYYQRDIDSAWEELRTKKTKIEMDKYNRDNERNRQKRDEYEATHGIPTPPARKEGAK